MNCKKDSLTLKGEQVYELIFEGMTLSHALNMFQEGLLGAVV